MPNDPEVCESLQTLNRVSECRETQAGHEYRGFVKTTSSGKQCQAWTSITTHVPAPYPVENFPDGSRAAAQNFCRNPDQNWLQGVWCYTMDPDTRWELCDVPMCGGK